MSADNIGVAASLDKYGEEDLFSLLVRYGLFFGAIFQFVCISAAVLMSGNETVDSIDESCLIDEPAPGSANAARRLHKIRKLEKKKRR